MCIVKAMSRFFGPKITHYIVIFYWLTFVAIIHNLIKNTFYISIMAVLDKDDLRLKRMTISDFLSSMKTLLRFSKKKGQISD